MLILVLMVYSEMHSGKYLQEKKEGYHEIIHAGSCWVVHMPKNSIKMFLNFVAMLSKNKRKIIFNNGQLCLKKKYDSEDDKCSVKK